MDEPAEVIAAGLEATVGVPVEAGAPRRQQDDVAGEGSCPGDVDRLRHRRRRPDRHPRRGERGGDVAARLADGNDLADPFRGGRHRGQVESLVAAPGDQDDVIEAVDRRRRGVRRRRLRVVEPGDASGVGDQFDAMRGPTNDASAAPTAAVSANPLSTTRAAAASPFVTSWGMLRRIDETAAISPRGDTSTPSSTR